MPGQHAAAGYRRLSGRQSCHAMFVLYWPAAATYSRAAVALPDHARGGSQDCRISAVDVCSSSAAHAHVFSGSMLGAVVPVDTSPSRLSPDQESIRTGLNATELLQDDKVQKFCAVCVCMQQNVTLHNLENQEWTELAKFNGPDYPLVCINLMQICYITLVRCCWSV